MPDKKMARHVTHGLTGKRVYKTWESMKARCYNPNDGKYEKYGGRGIKVCEEWLGKDGARNFAKWAYENGFDENKHQKEQSIDRIDVMVIMSQIIADLQMQKSKLIIEQILSFLNIKERQNAYKNGQMK